MAGIGWKLERMLERDTLGSTLAAPLRRALTFSLVAFLAVGTVTMLIVRPPLDIAVPGAQAVRVAILQVVSIGGATLIATAAGAHPALGAATGSVIPALYALFVVRKAVSHLVPDTFQSQPF